MVWEDYALRGPNTEGAQSLTAVELMADHGHLQGLLDDDHGIYALLAGRSGGQTLKGGTGSAENLTLNSTAHATKGSVYLGSSSLFDLDETTGRLKLPTTGSGAGLLVGGDAHLYRAAADVWSTPDSLRVGGYSRIGSETAPTNITAGDLTVARLFVTNAALNSEARLVQIYDSYSPGTGQFNSSYFITDVTPGAGAGSDEVRVFKAEINVRPTANHAGQIIGLYLEADHDSGAFNVTTMYGLRAQVVQNVAVTTLSTGAAGDFLIRPQLGTTTAGHVLQIRLGESGDAGTMTNFFGIRITGAGSWTATSVMGINLRREMGGGGTVTTVTGLNIENLTTGTITNHIGIEIAVLTRGGTLNIGIRNASSLLQSGNIGFFTVTTAVAQQTSGANLTNNVTSGGVDNTIANYTDLVIYANDAAAIRNDIYQLARKLKQVNDGLRAYGLLT